MKTQCKTGKLSILTKIFAAAAGLLVSKSGFVKFRNKSISTTFTL